MAAYATYKHVELFNVGKTKKRVLQRPAGGISSNIFGTETTETPRVVKNHMASNILAAGKESNSIKNNVRQGAHRFYFIGDQPRRGQKNVDSYTRLFGEPERPFTPAKNYLKSNLPFGPNAEVAKHFLANANGHNSHTKGKGGSVSTSASSSVTSSTENLKINSVSKTDGTPITGDHSMANNGAQVIMKNRVPPGGFSSGLW